MKELSFKLGITRMRFLCAGIGALCSWNRALATRVGVLFAGVGFFCGTAGAMATKIGIPFAGVWVLCGGAGAKPSGLWSQFARVEALFCGVRDIFTISGCYLISPIPLPFSTTLFVLLQVLESASSFWMSDTQEHHWNGKTWYDDRWNRY
jgi:hypothetical protein